MTTPSSSPIRHLLTGAGLRFISLLMAAAIGFFMTPFLIRELGEKYFGLWTLVSSFTAMYTLLDLGLSGTVGRFVAVHTGKNDFQSVNVFVNTAIVIYCVMGVVVFFVATALTFFASSFVETTSDASLFALLILIVGSEFAISFPLRALAGTITGKLRYDVSTGLEIAFKFLSTALIVTSISLGGKLVSLATIGLILGILRGITWYIALRKIFPEVRISPRLAERKAVRSLFGFSIFAFVAQMADFLRFQVDNLVIGVFLGPKHITHYTISVTLSIYFINAMVAIMGVTGSVFAQQHGKGDLEGMKRMFDFSTRVAVSLASFMGFGLLAWGHPFIHRWVGHEYLDAYPCLAVMTIGLTFALWQTSSVTVLYSRGKPHLYAIINSVEAVANLVCSMIFVQYWGIFGVALGTCLPMIVVKLILQPLFVSQALEMPLLKYYFLLYKAAFYSLIALIVPAIFTYWVKYPSYPALFAVGSFAAITYIPAVVMLNFSSDERRKIANSLTKHRLQPSLNSH
ncbi:MAG: lipopolysaccharide biosynthesis protein [Planctomycetaceae bacterium]